MCFNLVSPEVVRQLDYMIVVGPFQLKKSIQVGETLHRLMDPILLPLICVSEFLLTYFIPMIFISVSYLSLKLIHF